MTIALLGVALAGGRRDATGATRRTGGGNGDGRSDRPPGDRCGLDQPPEHTAGRRHHRGDGTLPVASGPRTALGRGVSIGMTAVRRGRSVVQQASGPSGLWQFPMSVTVAAGRCGRRGDERRCRRGPVRRTDRHGRRPRRSSAVRRPATSSTSVASDGSIVSFAIGHVAADAEVGGTEIVMSPEQADTLGATRVDPIADLRSVRSREALDAALAARGLVDGTTVRVRRSLGPARPGRHARPRPHEAVARRVRLPRSSTVGLQLDAGWAAANIARVEY